MPNPGSPSTSESRGGLSIVDLSVAAVVVGVIAALAVPRWILTAERERAAQAFAYLRSVRQAQQGHRSAHGQFAAEIERLDMDRVPPAYFTIGPVRPLAGCSLAESWSLTLVRTGAGADKSPYRVTFTQDGYDRPASDIAPSLEPAEVDGGDFSRS